MYVHLKEMRKKGCAGNDGVGFSLFFLFLFGRLGFSLLSTVMDDPGVLSSHPRLQKSRFLLCCHVGCPVAFSLRLSSSSFLLQSCLPSTVTRSFSSSTRKEWRSG